MRMIRRMIRHLFGARPIRLPGAYPWTAPAPMAYGTILIPGEFPVIADGKGGILVHAPQEMPDRIRAKAKRSR